MRAQIPSGEFIDGDGNVVSPFSGRIERERDGETDGGYGVTDSVRAVMAAVDDKGMGLRLRWDEHDVPVRIRDVSLRTRATWFTVVKTD